MSKESRSGTGEMEPIALVGWICDACNYASPFTVYGTNSGMFADMHNHAKKYEQYGNPVSIKDLKLQFITSIGGRFFERSEVGLDQFLWVVTEQQIKMIPNQC